MAQARREPATVVVSHGPQCLDGIVSAVVVARSRLPAPTRVEFTAHADVNQLLLAIGLERAPTEVWITDMSWTDAAVDRHLARLSSRGTQLFWIDHHHTAIKRHARASERTSEKGSGTPSARSPFTGLVLDDSHCAAWLTYEFVLARARQLRHALPPDFRQLETLVAMTDDHDRWIHRRDGSRALAATVAEMETHEAYRELLRIDESITYTERMTAAAARVELARRKSFEVADQSRTEVGTANGTTVIAAVCDGYASDIAAAWGESRADIVIALYDVRSRAISLRRSPGCKIDLSSLAEVFGGGGHPGAAGFRPRDPETADPAAILEHLLAALPSIPAD